MPKILSERSSPADPIATWKVPTHGSDPKVHWTIFERSAVGWERQLCHASALVMPSGARFWCLGSGIWNTPDVWLLPSRSLFAVTALSTEHLPGERGQPLAAGRYSSKARGSTLLTRGIHHLTVSQIDA